MHLRGAAQGFIAFVTLGVGMFIGSLVFGPVVDAYKLVDAAGAVSHNWAGHLGRSGGGRGGGACRSSSSMFNDRVATEAK